MDGHIVVHPGGSCCLFLAIRAVGNAKPNHMHEFRINGAQSRPNGYACNCLHSLIQAPLRGFGDDGYRVQALSEKHIKCLSR